MKRTSNRRAPLLLSPAAAAAYRQASAAAPSSESGVGDQHGEDGDSDEVGVLLRAELLAHPVDAAQLPAAPADNVVPRDVHSEVAAGVDCLRRLGAYSGSLVLLTSVETSRTHIARVVAVADEYALETLSKPSTSSAAASTADTASTLHNKSTAHDDNINNNNDSLPSLFVPPAIALTLGLSIHFFLPHARPPEENNSNNSNTAAPSTFCIRVQKYDAAEGNFSLPFASHAQIARVRIPSTQAEAELGAGAGYSHLHDEDADDELDASLESYFGVPRLLTVGDVFIVPKRLSDDDEEVIGYDRLAAFKVVGLQGSLNNEKVDSLHWCVHRDHTALILAGTASSSLHSSLFSFNSPTPNPHHHIKLPPPFPPAPAVDQLISTISPSLHPLSTPLKLTTSILLIGPNGSGKRECVREAARVLGMHCVEFRGWDLVGSNEGSMAEKVKAAFERARRYAPAVMMVREFGALAATTPASK
eukprot:jgi/Chlat1/7693/Chrsp64S07144